MKKSVNRLSAGETDSFPDPLKETENYARRFRTRTGAAAMPRRLEIDLDIVSDTVSAETAVRTPQTIIGLSFAVQI